MKCQCKKSLAFIPLVIFVIIGVFLWQGLRRDPHKVPSPLIGKPVPKFSMESLFLNKAPISERDFKGHITLLNVFATWCVSCQVEKTTMLKIARTKKVVIYGLNYKDSRARAQAWLKKYGDPYDKVIYDPQGHLGIDWGVYGTPETFVVDANGVIRYKYVGPVTMSVWKDTLLPVINRINNNEKST